MTPLQQAEIYEQWAKTIRMCNEVGIKPYYKHRDRFEYSLPESLKTWEIHDLYFCLAIVEGKLVFEGDRLWNKLTGNELIVDGLHVTYSHATAWTNMTWNPPKPKTILVEMSVEDAEYMKKRFEYGDIGVMGIPVGTIGRACKKALEAL